MKKKPGRIDPRTARPDSAYPKRENDAEKYVRQFSRELGLKPALTMIRNRKVKL